MKFEALNITKPILRALREQGYESPTPIQEQAIPPALKGRDVLGCAQTGTGKTCAFGVPILQRLSEHPAEGRPIRALILTPTRELAIQIQECFEAYGKYLPLKSVVIFGGVGQNPQVEALQAGADILVATPGRLLDLHQQGLVDVSRLEIFVLDEADRMLDMGFIHDVKKVLAWLPKKKQTLFFSATMPKEITELVNSLLHNPVRVAVNPVSSPVEVIRQRLYYVDRNNKTALLAQILQKEKVSSALVFTRTKHGANKVAGELAKRGISAAAIHGNKSQTARQAALAGFKDGSLRILVATDIAARGLDIEELPYVFNYNLPDVPETYVHRIGRTGRAGREGTAISFCDISEKEMLEGIEKLLKRPIPVVKEHDFPMVVLEAPKKDKHGRIINSEDQEARDAAREKSRQRREPAEKAPAEKPPKQEKAPKQEKPVRQDKPVKQEPPARKAPKQDKKKQSAPAPKTEESEELLPTALRTAKKERPYVRPERTRSLEDFLKDTEAEEYDYSEFPLLAQWMKEDISGPAFLDATDRMFATHSSKYRDAYEESHPQKNRQEKRQEEKPAEEKHEEKSRRQSHKKKKSGAPAQQPPKQEQPVKQQEKTVQKPDPRKQEKKKAGKQTAEKLLPKEPELKLENTGKSERLLKSNGKKRRDFKTPPRMERSVYATQKDSTEQKSLMKPHYISKKQG